MSAELWGSLLQHAKAVAPAWLSMNGWVCSGKPSITACQPCSNMLGTKSKGWRGVWKELPSEPLVWLLQHRGDADQPCSLLSRPAWLLLELLCRVTSKFCLWNHWPSTAVECTQPLQYEREKMAGKKTLGGLLSVTVTLCQGAYSCLQHGTVNYAASEVVVTWCHCALCDGEPVRSFAILPHSVWSGFLPWMLRVCAAFWPKSWRAMRSWELKSSCFDGALGCEHPSFLWPCRQSKKPSGTSLLSSVPSHRKKRQLSFQTLSHICFYFKWILLSYFSFLV